MFLKDIEIISIAPCIVVPNRIRFRARFSDDITGVMPYLNAIIKNAVYNHEGKVLSLTKDERLITLYSREVTVAKALNEEDAHETAAWLKDLINNTHADRGNISPVYERRSRPTPLVIYGWLPQKTGCRRCGEQTCLAFAAQLVNGGKRLDHCPVIWEPGNEDLLESLKEMMGVLV